MARLPSASALQRKQRTAVTAVQSLPLSVVTPSNNPTTMRPVTKSPLFRSIQQFAALLTTAVAYPGIFQWGVGSTNSLEDREKWDLGAVTP